MVKNKQYDMLIEKSKNMKIVEENNEIKLVYTYKIIKRTTIRKNKGKTVNKMYAFYYPAELIDYYQLRDNSIYFYKEGNNVIITSIRPSIEHQQIKVQNSNQASIPKSFFEPEKYDNVILTVDFSRKDKYSNKALLCMELM